MMDKKHGMTDNFRGIAWMCLASMLWALVEWIGHKVPTGHPALQTVWVRYAVHLGLMVVVLGPRYGMVLVRTRRPVAQIFRSLLMLGMPVCFIAAIGRLDVNGIWLIFWVSPLLVLALSQVWLGERVGLHLWLAAGGGLAGVFLMLAGRGLSIFHWSVILPIGMAACFGVYLVMTRAMREETTLANLFYTALCVWLALTMMLPLFWRPLTWKAAQPMIAIGVIGFFLLLAIDRSLHLAPAAVVAPIMFTEVIWSILISGDGALRFSAISVLAGAVLIVGSGLIIAAREVRSNPGFMAERKDGIDARD